MRVKLFSRNSNRFEAILLGNQFHLDLSLLDIRKALLEQVGDRMPKEYHFMYENIPVGHNQEHMFTLELFEYDKKKDVCVVPFEAKVQETNKASISSDSDGTPSTLWKDDLIPDKQHSQFKLPVSQYTEDEIENSHGTEKERRIFCNIKLEELAYMKIARSKEEIQGILDTSWTLKRVNLVELRFSELKTKEENLRTIYAEQFHRITHENNNWKAVHKNIEKLEFAKFLLTKHYSELLAKGPDCRTQKDVETDLDNDVSELKKHLSAIDKAMDQQAAYLQKLSGEIYKMYSNDCSVDSLAALDPEEERQIALDLLKEDEVDVF